MQHIDTIIFDLGGVLINLDYYRTVEEMQKLGIDLGFSKEKQQALFDDIEEGKISPDEFIDSLLNSAKKERVQHKEIIKAWNSILLDFPLERLKLLESLSQNYNTFLYSNTNAIHIEEVNQILNQSHNISNLNSHFKKVYLSHELGIRKPKKEGFQRIIEENNLNPKNAVFIDDSIQHVEGARQANLNAIHLDLKTEDIHQLLRRINILEK